MPEAADIELAAAFAAALGARLGDELRRVSLYGSRARRQHRVRSDYDLMLVIAQPTGAVRSLVHNEAVHWELEKNISLSTKILSLADFERLSNTTERFWRNFRRDELRLWPTNYANG